MVIARIADNVHNAPERAVETAHRAETAGYRHVQVAPDLAHGTYVVTADKPNNTPGR